MPAPVPEFDPFASFSTPTPTGPSPFRAPAQEDVPSIAPDLGFDPAAVSHPGTGSIRVWTGSINAIQAPIAHEQRPAPVFGDGGTQRDPGSGTGLAPGAGAPTGLAPGGVAPGAPVPPLVFDSQDSLSAIFDTPPPYAPRPASPEVPAPQPAPFPQPQAFVEEFAPAEGAVAPPPIADPPLFDVGQAEEFAGLFGTPPQESAAVYTPEADGAAYSPWPESGWLTDESYAPDPYAAAPAPFAAAPPAQVAESEGAVSMGGTGPASSTEPYDAAEESFEWAGPPPMLPDGRAPWLDGPDATRPTAPRTRSTRLIIHAALWVLAGIALGAAAWAAMALLGESNLFSQGPAPEDGIVSVAGTDV
jgi:hypothetical protein